MWPRPATRWRCGRPLKDKTNRQDAKACPEPVEGPARKYTKWSSLPKQGHRSVRVSGAADRIDFLNGASRAGFGLMDYLLLFFRPSWRSWRLGDSIHCP